MSATSSSPFSGASPAQPSRLSRRLGLNDAVFIGLGSMIGAGVFAAIGPAAAAAGSGLLIGLGIAALVAYCNATSSAQLAAVYPESGGAYIYGRNRLGPRWGYLAGWMFVVGKTASCAAIALTFGAYVAPAWQRPLAVAAVVLLTSINYRGIQQTARTLRLTVAIVLVSLAAMIIAVLGGSAASLDNLGSITQGGWAGILESAGLLFFSFAGYARIATLAEEVADPVRTIPRAIPRALGIALLVYLVVAGTALIAIGPSALASAAAPLEAAVRAGSLSWSYPVVRLGAVVATLGVLLSLIAGVSRTVFAMASNRDLPSWLGPVHPIFRVPHRAELAVGAVVCILVAVSDLRGAIGFSSFSVLLYYAVANASAWTLPSDQRRWPRFLAVAGVAGCLVLASTLPRTSVIVGLAVLALGVVLMSVTKELN
ncbi:MAG: amino acid permease [Acidimicrobiia bacterium]|nr:amino acid permease [Acidimicrobiia bacterium]